MPESCTIGPGIGCDDYIITYADAGASTIQLLLRNGKGESLTNVDVAISNCTDSTSANGDDSWTDGAVLGGSGGITLTNCASNIVASSGSRVKTDITITYTGDSGLNHTMTGTITAKAQ